MSIPGGPSDQYFFDDHSDRDDDIPDHDPFEDADWQYEQEAESWD